MFEGYLGHSTGPVRTAELNVKICAAHLGFTVIAVHYGAPKFPQSLDQPRANLAKGAKLRRPEFSPLLDQRFSCSTAEVRS